MSEMDELTFVARDVESAYLNQQRAHERFLASSGAISTLVKRASNEGGGKVGIGGTGLEATTGRAREVTYDISDPFAQALLLRTSVEDRGLLRALGQAKRGEYVEVTGESCYRHSSLPEAQWHTSNNCAPADELEQWREGAEQLRAPFNEAGGPSVYLLMIQLPGGSRAAALAGRTNINDTVIPRQFHRPWTTFGTLEEEQVGDTPLITPIYSVVDYPVD